MFICSIATIPEYAVEVIPTHSISNATKSSSIPDCGGLISRSIKRTISSSATATVVAVILSLLEAVSDSKSSEESKQWE